MYNTKNKTQKAYKKNKPNLNLIPKNCVCVFPIEIVGGKTQVSNLGIMPNRRYYDKGSFLYWQEVFDGRSALKLQWEDSITLEKPEGKNYYLAKTSVGTYYYGKPISNGTEQLEISEDASFEDFMSMKASQSITLRFEYDPTNRTESWYELQEKFRFTLVDNDIYNLYLIPELCEEKIMYISEYQEYYDDLTGESKGCEITFSTLGDKIQKSGKAIEQYCSWNAPGEFSVRPMVIPYYNTETEKWEKEVIINPKYLYFPNPVKYLQVEQQGPALTSTIYAIGRKQEWDEENSCWKVGPSKFLLPYQFITTQPNPLNRTSTPSKNFFCFPNEQVTMVTDNALLEWILNKATQPLEQVKNAGMISIGKDWVSDGSEVSLDHKSNEVSGGVRKDYFDTSWLPLSYTDAYLTAHDTTGCIYAESQIAHKATDSMIDIMNKNAFIYNSQPIIPLSFYSTRPYYLRDIPIIGAIGNFFKIGDIKLTNKTTGRKATSLCFFGDADVMTMCANLNGSMGTVFRQDFHVFPINFFGTNEAMYQKLGVNSVNTTFCFELTDRIQLDGVSWDTIYLGQSTYEDHTEENPHYLFPSTHQSLLVNSTLKAVQATETNFIIDAIVVQSIFDGKIKLSCYSEQEKDFIYPEWTATILSNANWENGNVRDWTNIFLLSNWEERFCKQEDEFTWPLGPHKREETEDYVWETNIEDTFAYEAVIDPTHPQILRNWQSVSGGNWGKTETNPLLPGFKGWRANRSKTLFTGTKAYSDLGVASVTDKDSFITYYKNFDFNFIGSSLSISTSGVSVKSRTTGKEFTTGVYTYTQTLDICSANVRTGQNWFNTSDNHFCGEETPYSLPPSYPKVCAFDQHLEVTLTLGDTGITYTLEDKSYIYSLWNAGTYNTNIVTFHFNKSKAIGIDNEPFKSVIKSPDITFHKRS